MLGRTFLPTESQDRGAHPVAFSSYGFWRRHLNSAADAVGRTINLNGHFHTVVGVAPEQFQGDSLHGRNLCRAPRRTNSAFATTSRPDNAGGEDGIALKATFWVIWASWSSPSW